MAKPLAGFVCLVTGATRGIGKGIAVQLGEAGATVYVTGRTLTKTEKSYGSLTETVEEINGRGGRGIAVQVDHSKDNEITGLFDKIKREQNGQLDVLVNNAYSGVSAIMENMGKPFWEQPLSMWDDINNVGLRNHYICSVLAAQMMVPRNSGLIVDISSAGGLVYTFNVSYGVGKEACDRMAVDCALELKKHGVSCISLWPGFVQTELLVDHFEKKDPTQETAESRKIIENFLAGESPEFSGKCIVHLLMDKQNLIKKSGHVLITADLGDEYGFTDIGGQKPWSVRSLKFLVHYYMNVPRNVADWIPNFIKFPGWMVTLIGKKL